MAQPLVIGYSLMARVFHWVTAVAVLTAAALAVFAINADLGSEEKKLMFFWHKSFGVFVLAVAVLRIAHRLINGAPGPHPQLPPLEKTGSQAAHVLLYILILAVPLLGWLATSAMGSPPSFFGLFTLPALIPVDKQLGEKLFDLHVAVAFFLVGLAAIHILFALYHGFVRQDGVLTRMIFGTNRGIGPA